MAGSFDTLKQSKADKKEDKRKALESLRGMLPTDFSCIDKFKDKKQPVTPSLADFTKLLETAPSSSKKAQEQQMKEAIEQLSKSHAEFIAKAFTEEQPKQGTKRSRESISSDKTDSSLTTEEENPAKVAKEAPPIAMDQGVDIETLLPPSTVVKGGPPIEDDKEKQPESPAKPAEPAESESTPATSQNKEETVSDNPESPPKKTTKRTRNKRKSGELPLDHEAVIEKKNLRSSASRSAAAAAARAAAEQAAARLEAEKAAQENQDAAS